MNRIPCLIFISRYILYYSPAVYKIDGNEFETLNDYRKYFNMTSRNGAVLDESIPYYGGIKVPATDYGSGKTSIVLVTMAVFIDSLAIAGIYIQYKGNLKFEMACKHIIKNANSQYLYLLYYFYVFAVKVEMLIPWLFFYALLIPGLLGAGVANAILQESVTNKYYSIVPLGIALLYTYLWISVVRLYRTGGIKKNVIMRGFGDIFLQPLTSKVAAYVEENETSEKLS